MRVLRQAVGMTVSALLVIQPMLAHAQSVPPIIAAGSTPQTSVDQTQNGLPLVNIASPNGSGVSLNQFSQFSVGPGGAVINNSPVTGTSALGGMVYGNPSLQGGTARLIINEVTGGSRSSLQGTTEIFGRQAEYILANPNGITCDGCGFINTPQATLTTGVPVLGAGGALDHLAVSRGDITVGPGGLDARAVDAFDLVGRSVSVNGPVHGTDLGVTAGANTFDPKTRTATATAADPATTPLYGIDSSAIGGMYAGRITLIGTEAGVGVRMDGTLATSARDLVLSANGKLEIARATSAADLSLTSSGALTVGETATASGTATVTAQDTTIAAGATLGAGGNVSLTTRDLTVDGRLAAGLASTPEVSTPQGSGTLTATASGAIRANGTVTAADRATLSGQTVAVAGQITAAGPVSLNATADSGTALSVSGGVQGQSVTLTTTGSGGALDLSGTVTATDSLTLTAAGSATAAAGSTLQAPDLALTSGGPLTLAGTVSGTTVTATAGTALDSRGSITATGNATLRAGTTLTQQAGASLKANGTATLISPATTLSGSVDADSVTLNDGTGTATVTADAAVTGRNTVTVAAASVSNAGKISAGETARITGTTAVSNAVTATLLARDLGVVAAGLTNAGRITAGQALTLQVNGSLTNTSALISSGSLVLTGLTDLTNRDLIFARTALTVEGSGALVNDGGTLLAGGDLRISGLSGGKAAQIANTAGTIESTDGDITLSAQDIRNTGNQTANGLTWQTVFQRTYQMVSDQSVPPCTVGEGCAYFGAIAIVPDPRPGFNGTGYWGTSSSGHITSTVIQQVATSVTGPTAVISAGRDLRISGDSVENRQATLSAARDMTLSGGTLRNIGISGSAQWIISAVNETMTRCYSYGNTVCSGFDNGGGSAGLASWTTDIAPATIQAGRALTATFTGDISNVVMRENTPPPAGPQKVMYDQLAATAPDLPTGSVGLDGGTTLDSATLQARLSAQMPGFSSLYSRASASSNTLYETRFPYVDLGTFYGSDYFLSRVGGPTLRLEDLPKRLGDAFFDTRLIRDAVVQATGQRWLDAGVTDDRLQYKALIDNAATVSGTLRLAVGVALTAEQIAHLDRDIVWYETVLVDGQPVLTPRLYLAQAGRVRLAGGGALIAAGGDMTLTSGGSVAVLEGRIAAGQALAVTAGQDLQVLSGTVQAGTGLTLTAGRDVVAETLLTQHGDGSQNRRDVRIGQTDLAAGGGVKITAGRDVGITGAGVQAGQGGTGGLAITAGRDLTVQALAQSRHESESGGKGGYTLDAVTHSRSTLTAAGDISLSAGQDIALTGARAQAGGAVEALAGRDLTVASVVDSLRAEGWTRKSSSSTDSTEERSTHQAAEIRAGGSVLLGSLGGDLTLRRADVSAGGDLTLLAPTGTVSLLGGTDSSFEQHKRSGGSLLWQSSRDRGEVRETFTATRLETGGALTVTAGQGVIAELPVRGDLKASLAEAAAQPGMAWVAQLATRPDVNWRLVQEHYDSWDHKSQGLTGPAAALIAIAVGIATYGAGSGLGVGLGAVKEGALAAGIDAAASAAVSTLASQATVSLINNRGNIGAVLKEMGSSATVRSLLIAMGTAGLTAGLASELNIDISKTADFQNKLAHAALRAGTGTVLNSTIGGQRFEDALKSGALSMATTLASQVLFEKIGDLAADHGLAEGDLRKVVMHAVAGCAVGQITQQCVAGAIGAGLQEAAGGLVDRLSSSPERRVQLSGLIAATATLLTGGDAGAVNAANSVAQDARTYNRELHPEEKTLNKLLAEELSRESGRTQIEEREILDRIACVIAQCQAGANPLPPNDPAYQATVREMLILYPTEMAAMMTVMGQYVTPDGRTLFGYTDRDQLFDHDVPIEPFALEGWILGLTGLGGVAKAALTKGVKAAASLTKVILAAGLEKREGSALAKAGQQTGSGVWKTTRSDAEKRKHIFSENHKNKGIMDLGPSENYIVERAYDAIRLSDRQGKLREGMNNIIVKMNGHDATIRTRIQNGEMQSINIFKGTSNREGQYVIDLR